MIYTSRFANKKINNAEHIPVRIARYHPRFKLSYKIEEKIELLMPTKQEMFHLPPAEFEKTYSMRIAQNIEAISKEFTRINNNAAGRDILLLCYEDVHAGQRCHRRLFAKIWKEQTGQEIPEL